MATELWKLIWISFHLISSSSSSCRNILLTNRGLSQIHSLNFDSGQFQPDNVSCSWVLSHPHTNDNQNSFYLLSLRSIEIDDDPRHWSNELILKSGDQYIIPHDLYQRSWRFSSSSPLEIEFRSKKPMFKSITLNIRRLLLEWIWIEKPSNPFHCPTIVKEMFPPEWICNCLDECAGADEWNCPLCSKIKSTENLLCRSNEIWCLPVISSTESHKGFCVPREENAQCSYSSRSLQCDSLVTFDDDQGQLTIDRTILSRENFCFILLAKEKHRIQLIINQLLDLDLFISDGNSSESQLSLPGKYEIKNHFVIVRLHRSSKFNEKLFVNLNWSISLCPENQTLCSGQFERKCFTTKQRCDGVWDCLNGDDELGCFPQSCPTTFACHDPLHMPSDLPRCYPRHERCNGNAYCANRMDERFCSKLWCNSNNGTFLCKNLNCIYELWTCDGADDCGDNSDEQHCSSHLPRRIITGITIGVTICMTLFLIAIGCSCKLYHLRSAERRTSIRLLNPQAFLGQQSADPDELRRRMAPPSYNQTMGFTDDHEERYALLAENLRLAGLADVITIAPIESTTSRGRRRHRRRSHNSRAVTTTTMIDRFRSFFLSPGERLQSNELEINEPHRHSIRSSSASGEQPPAYFQENFSTNPTENLRESSTNVPMTNSSAIEPHLLPKRQQSSCLDNDEDPLSSDDEKMLIP